MDKNRCTIDDIISFKIEFENADSFSNIDISSLIKDFTVISGPSQQTSMQWINGKLLTLELCHGHYPQKERVV